MTPRSEEIRKIAYELWQIEGEPEGRDKDHWERATRIYESRSSVPEPTATLGSHYAEPNSETSADREDVMAADATRDDPPTGSAAPAAPPCRRKPSTSRNETGPTRSGQASPRPAARVRQQSIVNGEKR